jgi:L-proline---[L-prolyl-carrier protein] ligase
VDYLLHHLLQTSAEAQPEHIAVVDGTRSASFAELETRSNRLARLLLELGVRRGDRVGIYLDKSLESLVGIYGVLKAGAVYVPFDPQAPAARLAYIARNCDVGVLITGQEKADAWADLVTLGAPLRTLVVANATDDDGFDRDRLPETDLVTSRALESQPATPPSIPTIDLELAYILYTSGSTGDPKGVKLSHLNALTFVNWAAELCRVSGGDRLSSHAPLHFDLSVFDIFAAAKGGARVVLVPAEALVFPSETARFIGRAGITVWYSVPSALSMLVQRGGLQGGEWPHLRAVFFAGEVFPIKYLRRLMQLIPHAEFFNLYGPTETNVCTYYRVPPLAPDSTEPIPIGVAISNTEVFAVTEEGAVAGVGEVGELYVRGAGVMQGYWGDPERTSGVLDARPLPLDSGAHDVAYRTGDLVRLGSDGNHHLLGRKDSQIKSRGYRIELGDIEATLYAHPGVVECAAMAVPEELITNRIKAYVVVRDGIGKPDLIRFCSERIPRYMIPDTFEFRSELPKTSTGKIDRRALSALVVAGWREI